jgi:phosphatidylglycerol lysyltransferase
MTAKPDLWASIRKAALASSPQVCSVALFLGGAALLISAATPQLAARLRIVSEFAPLAAIEVSHFIESLVATLMMLVSAGVWRRMNEARRAAMALCLIAAPMSLFRGGLWEEAVLLVLLALALWKSKPAFYRRSRLSAMRPDLWWLAGAVLALGVAAWAGFAAYEHIPYSDELWWTFLVDGDVSRFLRAVTGVVLLGVVIVLWRLAGALHPERATDVECARAVALVESARERAPEAWLAATGDKSFLFSASGDGMVMYAPHGGAWIAMGGPVGENGRDMIWRFREAADVANAWPAFYALPPDRLADMLDAGFAAQKIGETALVELADFALEGSARAKLRNAKSRAVREGLVFAVERAAADSAVMAEMRAVSDAWLGGHTGAEKRFSLGRFDEAYLARFPVGLFRKDGRVIAFANLWPGEAGGDIAVDLMRAHPDAPRVAMEALFVEMMLWAKGEGFARFDLGMAPLAGLEDRRFAPLLSRAGAFVYRHGGSIYGFEGLRAFKDKFDPVWEGRYLAAPGAWRLSAALWRTALLTSGGLRGMLKG